MIRSRRWTDAGTGRKTLLKLGAAGHLFLFIWTLATILLAPLERTGLAALICLAVAAIITPGALRRALRLRWLVLIGLMALPSLFLPGSPAVTIGDLSLSYVGLQTALRSALRALVILVAVDGFTASTDVTAIAGIFERAGLNGLGFALGVALNLLPILRETASTTWNSLRMRGGLRRQPLRALRYYLVTVVSSALQRAADIALAAESRAFDPRRSRPAPLQRSPYDVPLAIAGLALFLTLCFMP